VLNDFFHEELPLPKNYFDCIIFNDVLEHMTDPWAALEFSKSLLKCQSDIYIIGSIPNFRFWGNIKEIILQKDFNYKSSGILDKLHFRFFTFKSIKRMFEECGYEIEIVKGINEEVNWKFKLLNFLLFNSINDMRFLQFAFVAKPTIR
jgi:ubiquinone/menaquinone biosynthesis C-methylase UbiE